MISVRKDDGTVESFNKDKIIDSIRKETGCTGEIIEEIVDEVYNILNVIKIQSITGPLIREFINTKFLERGLIECRKKYTRVGLPIFEARRIDTGWGRGDNANLQNSPETGHKRKADQLSKEQYILMLPDHISESHLNADIHIHDLEYFGSRQFCLDGSVILPYMSNGYMRTQRLDEFKFNDDNCFYPTDMQVLNPGGLKRVSKVTRRMVGNEQLIKVITSDGRSVKITKEHRIPKFNDGYNVVLAKDLKVGDVLQPLKVMDYTFNSNITQINLLTALIERVPSQHLDTVYVRNIRHIYDYIKTSCNYKSYTEMAIDLNIPLSRIKSGISQINDFYNLITIYKIDNIGGAVISCIGNKRSVPIILDLTQSLMYILGTFVGDGNYNVDLESHSYNLVISNTEQNDELCSRIHDLGSFYTINVATNGGKQVYFGGKLWYLLFKYVFCIPEYAQHKRIPDIVYNTTPWLRQAFIEGMFSTDSSVNYDPKKSSCQIIYHTTSENLRQEIIILLSQYGIKTSFCEVEKRDNYSTLYRILISGWDAISIFTENFTLLQRKQDQINAFLKAVSPIYRSPVGCNIKKLIECASSSEWVYDVFLEKSNDDIDHCYYAGDGLLVHNCLDSDLRYFFYHGFVGDGTGDHTSFAAPASRPEVAILHAVKVLGSSQTNCAGGQGFYNFLCFLAPYFKGCEYDVYKQCMQMFVYEMTQMLVARGGQVVFSSVQLSPSIPEIWKDIPVVYKGKRWDGIDNPLQIYGDFEKENRLLFKALMEVMIEGDYNGKPFYFPKPEISIEPQFIETMKIEDITNLKLEYPTIRDLYLLSFKLASKFGTPYFDNQIPMYRGSGKGISCYQCCAYNFASNPESDSKFNDKLYFNNGAHFSMGSYQVVTINFPRLAYESTTFEELLIHAQEKIDICCEIFKLKRELISQVSAPFLEQSHGGSKLVDFEALVYTIGVIGINEVCEILTGKTIYEDPIVTKQAMNLILQLKKYCKEKSKECGFTIAFARTPAETTAQRFAVSDLLNYGNAHRFVKGNIKEAIRVYAETGSRDLPIYYTNGTHCPVDSNISIQERIKIEQAFFPLLDGGNICNIYLGEKYPDSRGLMDMTLNICKSTNLGYFAFTKDFTVCKSDYRFW